MLKPLLPSKFCLLSSLLSNLPSLLSNKFILLLTLRANGSVWSVDYLVYRNQRPAVVELGWAVSGYPNSEKMK
jgi:hypothetical protein